MTLPLVSYAVQARLRGAVSFPGSRTPTTDSGLPLKSRRADVELPVGRGGHELLSASCVLDEHLLDEAIRFLHVLIVMALAHLPDLGQLLNPELSAALTEGLEGVLGLPGHDDIAHQPEVIALPRRIGEILRHAKSAPGNALDRPADVVERIVVTIVVAQGSLEFLEHSLVLAHPWNVTRAEIPKALVLCLRLMIDE